MYQVNLSLLSTMVFPDDRYPCALMTKGGTTIFRTDDCFQNFINERTPMKKASYEEKPFLAHILGFCDGYVTPLTFMAIRMMSF